MASCAPSVYGKSQIRYDFRVLAGLLLDKPISVPDRVDMKVVEENMRRLYSVVKGLCDAPERIQKFEIYLHSGESVTKMAKRSLEDENNDPAFDSKVKKVGDIPAGWLWAWFAKATASAHEGEVDKAPSQKLVEAVSASATNMKHIRQFATGLPDQLALSESLREKSNCVAFFSHRHAERNSILKLGKAGFFGEAVRADGKVTFEGIHGRFHFERDPQDENKVLYLLHTPSSSKVNVQAKHKELNLRMDTKILNNFDDWSAHVVIAQQKFYLHTLVGTMVKPKLKDIEMDVDVFMSERSKVKGQDHIAIDAETASATKRRRKPATPPAAGAM